MPMGFGIRRCFFFNIIFLLSDALDPRQCAVGISGSCTESARVASPRGFPPWTLRFQWPFGCTRDQMRLVSSFIECIYLGGVDTTNLMLKATQVY